VREHGRLPFATIWTEIDVECERNRSEMRTATTDGFRVRRRVTLFFYIWTPLQENLPRVGERRELVRGWGIEGEVPQGTELDYASSKCLPQATDSGGFQSGQLGLFAAAVTHFFITSG
jgi:hypothetical protein